MRQPGNLVQHDPSRAGQEQVAETDSPPAPGAGSTAIRGGAIRAAGYTAGVLVSLGTASILVRHLGVPAFGRYITVTSLIALVGAATEAGIYVYGIREFNARAEPARRQLVANLLAMRLALTIVGIVVAVCFTLIVGYQSALVLGTAVAGAGLLAQLTGDVLSIALQARLELGRLAAIDFGRRVIALLFVGALALTGAGLVPFLAAWSAAAALSLAVLARVVRGSITVGLSFDWRTWRELFAETLPFAIASSIGAVYFYVTVILMSLIASGTQTGFFATSFRVVQVALGIPILLLTAVFPLISGAEIKDRPEAGEIVGKVFTVAVLCGVWMSLATAIGADFIIHVLAGRQGQGAVPVLQIQAVALTLTFISVAGGLTMISLRRYRELIIASSVGLILDIALGLVLIPVLHARGGAIADVTTEALTAIGLTIVVMKAVPQHRITRSLVAPVVCAAGLASTVLALPIGSAAHMLGATIIYFAVLLRVGAIPPDVLQAAQRVSLRRALRSVSRS